MLKKKRGKTFADERLNHAKVGKRRKNLHKE
jgi:hypothetical protein